jgi:CRISPR/Cas system-associated endonuclease Cas3-HD
MATPKAGNGTLLKFAAGIVGCLLVSGIVGLVVLGRDVSANEARIKGNEEKFGEIREDMREIRETQTEILLELRK